MKEQMKMRKGVFLLFGVIMSGVMGLFFYGCTRDNDVDKEKNESQIVIENFERIFCRDGKLIGIIRNPYELTTRTVGVEDNTMPCRIFTALTGMGIIPTSYYQASFTTDDGACIVSISGKLHSSNGEYATLSVQIPGYPQVKKICMIDAELLKDKNEVITDATTGEQSR